MSHTDVDAVAVCGRCNFGICQACASESRYSFNDKPLCGKCNYEVFLEHGDMLRALLKSRRIALAWFIVAFAAGLVLIFGDAMISAEMKEEFFATGVFACIILVPVAFYVDFDSSKRASADAIVLVILLTLCAPISVPFKIIRICIYMNKIKDQIAEHERIYQLLPAREIVVF
jgi:hypothetical protein